MLAAILLGIALMIGGTEYSIARTKTEREEFVQTHSAYSTKPFISPSSELKLKDEKLRNEE